MYGHVPTGWYFLTSYRDLGIRSFVHQRRASQDGRIIILCDPPSASSMKQNQFGSIRSVDDDWPVIPWIGLALVTRCNQITTITTPHFLEIENANPYSVLHNSYTLTLGQYRTLSVLLKSCV